MKNLKLFSEIPGIEWLGLEECLNKKGGGVVCSAVDIKRKRLFFGTTDQCLLTIYLPFPHKKHHGLCDATLPLTYEGMHLGSEPNDTVTAMEYSMKNQCLIVGMHSGSLFLMNMAKTEYSVTKLPTSVQGGIKSIYPSPDGVHLALTTETGNICVISLDATVDYSLRSFDTDSFLGGMPVKREYGPINWRRDGKYFAVLKCMEVGQVKQVNVLVIKRESCIIHFDSQLSSTIPIKGIVLNWMPNEAIAVTIYDRKSEHRCPKTFVFGETELKKVNQNIGGGVNQMGHIRKRDGRVVELKWSCSSDLLAAVVKYEQYVAVEIWSFFSNCWSLKQELRYLRNENVQFMWDPQSLQLFCWTSTLTITVYDFIWVMAVMENSTALVIDNSGVKMFSLDVPPIPLVIRKLSSAIQDMAFFSKNSKNRLAAILSEGSLYVAELRETKLGKEIIPKATLSNRNVGTIRHLTWLDSEILLGVAWHENGDTKGCQLASSSEGHCCCKQAIVVLHTDTMSSGWKRRVCIDNLIVAVAPNPASWCSAFFQFDGGRIVEYHSDLGTISQPAEALKFRFSSSCPLMNVILVYDNGYPKPTLFGLDRNGRLHIGSRILCNNCSSFSFYSKSTGQLTTHLILTTKKGWLITVDISDVLHDSAEVKNEKSVCDTNKIKTKSREFIKSGSILVGARHGEAAVILLTSQGNLEYIYPRKLVLEAIVDALFEERFSDAIVMVGKHVIDFNVIDYHLGWRDFLLSVEEFIRQVKNLGDPTDFNLDSLTDAGEGQDRDFKYRDAESKVTYVLLAIRKALEEQVQESPERELCILTSLAYSKPPDLEEALKRIKVIHEMELSGVFNPYNKSFPSTQEALKYLLLLSNVEAVYEAALGLYDLELSAMVAANSEQVLEEFFPYGMQADIMRYTIDLKLKRYESALKNIASAGDAYFDDCLSLMKDNPQLFSLGLKLFSDSLKWNQVLEAYGDHLFGEKYFEDAAQIYLRCCSLGKALESCHACFNWKQLLTLASLNLEYENVLPLADRLFKELQALGKLGEAARIALEYFGDVHYAIKLFAKAREWGEVMRAGWVHNECICRNLIVDLAYERSCTVIFQYSIGLNDVGRYLSHYLAARLATKIQPKDCLINDFNNAAASETSSSSQMCADTQGLEEMEMEMGLVEDLRKMCVTTDAQQELKSLLALLTVFGLEKEAGRLEDALYEYQLTQMAAVKLAEDIVSSKKTEDPNNTLDQYKQKLRGEFTQYQALLWM